MASSPPNLFSPSNKQECQAAIRKLSREKVISLDAEGVHLGKDGPLTLLQIGTLDGSVYLFDVMINENEQDKMFFTETGLNTILTSTRIVKVIQSCSGDSAALYHQFGIRLENVFDTQVAHLVIEEDKGKKLPKREKLVDICKLYSKNAEVYEGKEDVKLEWSKIAGNYWAKRPMTKEMIDYASGDVTALIPEVYETQNRYLENNGCLDLFAERVQEEIELDIDPLAKERRKERTIKIKMAILDEMAEKYSRQTDFASITDEDEIKALNDTSVEEMSGLPSVIQDLKRQSMASFLKSIEEKLETPETFNPDRGVTYKLNDIEHCGSEQLQKEATRIKQEVIKVITGDVQTKYNPDTPLENISSLEYQIIRGLKPLSGDSPRYQPTVIALHWKIAGKELTDAIDKLNADPNYNMTIPISKLRFFTNNPDVPRNTKRLAQALLEKQESTILQRIPNKYTRNTKIEELTDSERMVVGGLRLSSGNYNPVVVALHWKIGLQKLDKDLEDYRAGNLRVNDGLRRKLDFYMKNRAVPSDIKLRAKEFLQALPQSNRGGGRRY
ncbi:uncharacterized protein LOC123536181 [Mercenaria mercenaria]|uniref:uncharacterized protein LOC123536181 n=1 Tax=Mercenaria mercenaria TaxID=6596 RepID=UPI00234E7C73|nr:uncharacterized protein LOC123536181 [Mercenaria mercenaria]XP_053384103.1 uncharacterized protein LOC123536181 [Mercenaria mercenaria]